MTPLAIILYLIAIIMFLAAWVPIFIANQRKQSNRVTYLAFILLYLFAEIVMGWRSHIDPQDNPVHLWTWGGYVGHSSRLNIPLGFGVPICIAVLFWDAVTYLRPNKQALTAAQLDARTAQELSEQAKESPRKDYW